MHSYIHVLLDAIKKITCSFEFNSGQQTFIGIHHVESIVLGAGEDMDCANLSVINMWETVMNDVEIEAKCRGSMELGREI